MAYTLETIFEMTQLFEGEKNNKKKGAQKNVIKGKYIFVLFYAMFSDCSLYLGLTPMYLSENEFSGTLFAPK